MADLFDIAVARSLAGGSGGGGTSDFSMAEVTVIVGSLGGGTCFLPLINVNSDGAVLNTLAVSSNQTYSNILVPLGAIESCMREWGIYALTLTGDIEIDEEDADILYVFGDGTITVTGWT